MRLSRWLRSRCCVASICGNSSLTLVNAIFAPVSIYPQGILLKQVYIPRGVCVKRSLASRGGNGESQHRQITRANMVQYEQDNKRPGRQMWPRLEALPIMTVPMALS